MSFIGKTLYHSIQNQSKSIFMLSFEVGVKTTIALRCYKVIPGSGFSIIMPHLPPSLVITSFPFPPIS